MTHPIAPGGRDERPVLLLTSNNFRTGFEANGPTQSIAQMARALSDRFRFRVISLASPEEEPGRWTEFLGVEQLPLARKPFGAQGLARALRDTPHHLLILNSFFDPHLTIAPLVLRRLRRVPRNPVLLAPRGEFSPAALNLKSRKKRAYLTAAGFGGLLRGVPLQATTPEEAERIRAALPKVETILSGPIVRVLPPVPEQRVRAAGDPIRIAFLSRIDRMKNLDVALDAVAAAGVQAELDIYGLVQHPDYWEACQAKIAAMPAAVQVRYHGPIPQQQVIPTLAGHDLFLLPTRGENFGHAIADSLLAGTPVLISDRTPWRGLVAANAGWDLPLETPSAFAAAIAEASRWSEDRQRQMRAGARAYGEVRLDPAGPVAELERCFRDAMAQRSR